MRGRVLFVAAWVAAAAPAAAQASEALLKKHNCIACHAVDKKLIGPTYQDVAKKYKGQKGAEARLAASVKKGSKGVWGPVPMPPNAAVSDADIKEMVRYILAL